MFRNICARIQQNAIRTNCSQKIRCLTQSAKGTTDTAATECDVPRQYIEEAIKVQPLLATVSPQMWQKAHQTFANHGLSTDSFLQIVTGNPKVLSRPPQKIIDTLEYWRSCQFGENYIFLLITKYPTLMDVQDQRQLLKQISFLKSYVATSKNVWKLLMSCPNLMEQSTDTIECKINYMKEVMRIEIPEIIKSEALSKPLEDIMYRHVFLERLGLFKPRPLKADPNDPTTNPRLYKITDTSEKTFAIKICHVTLAEYEAFKELYSLELERKRWEEEEEDEEEDDDENDDDLLSKEENYVK